MSVSNIVPLDSGKLPAYLKNKTYDANVNADVATGVSFPTLSIKGKVWTLVKDNERKTLMRPDDPEETLQTINLHVVRANTKSRVYYAKSYVEGDSDGARPSCYSQDGVAPAANAMEPQAKKCAVCKHAVWGSKIKDDGTAGEGTECSVNTRLAVTDGAKLTEPMLLRVPAGSRKNFADTVKAAQSRGIPYNALVMKVSFDKEAPSPKLVFKLTGLLDDAGYEIVKEQYESDVVKEIVGLGTVYAALPAPAADDGGVDAAELDAAIAAKAATAKAAATKAAVKPPVKPVVDMEEIGKLVDPPAEKPAAVVKPAVVKPAVKPAAPPPDRSDDLLSQLDDLLGSTDD